MSVGMVYVCQVCVRVCMGVEVHICVGVLCVCVRRLLCACSVIGYGVGVGYPRVQAIQHRDTRWIRPMHGYIGVVALLFGLSTKTTHVPPPIYQCYI